MGGSGISGERRDSARVVADEMAMRAALGVAGGARGVGEVPVGAVVLDPAGVVIATAHNERERGNDPTAHAEILALRRAGAARGSWRLDGCTLAVTLEPCPMCAGAMVNARVRRVIFGCRDPKAGAVRTLFQIADDPRLNHRLEITADVLSEPCADLLKTFFKSRR